MPKTRDAENYLSGRSINSNGLRAAVQAERQFLGGFNKKEKRSLRKREARLEKEKLDEVIPTPEETPGLILWFQREQFSLRREWRRGKELG